MATIADVARLAGVSEMTVSRVINNKDNVTQATRNAVLRAVKMLNYQPNLVARTLASGSSGTFGLIFTHIKNPIYARYANGLSETLQTHGRDLILYMAGSVDAVKQGIKSLQSKQVDGTFVMPIEFSKSSPERDYEEARRVLYEASVLSGKPFVYLGPFKEGDNNCVYEEYEAGSRLAMDCLIAAGHRDIAFVAGTSIGGYPWSEREAGYRSAMAEHGLEVNERRLLYEWPNIENVTETIQRFVRQNRRNLPTAFYCANDILAVGVIHGLLEEHLRVPEDVSVIGHDDGPYATSCYPPLSTVAISPKESSRETAEMMIGILRKDLPATGNRIGMQPRLVLRSSTGKPRVS